MPTTSPTTSVDLRPDARKTRPTPDGFVLDALAAAYNGDYVSTWKAMTELLRWTTAQRGILKLPATSSRSRYQRDRPEPPVIYQIEVHPEFGNGAAVAATRRYAIAVETWSPLGQGKALENPTIGRIASNCGKSPAQIILRVHIQHGYIIFPKNTRRERMEENFSLFDFELTADEIATIDALDKGEAGRIGPNPDTFDWIP